MKEDEMKKVIKSWVEGPSPDMEEQIERTFNRLTGNISVPDKLWALRENIKNLRSQSDELSSELPYHQGSKLSQVVDLLNQAESLTGEVISGLNGETPSQCR